jgi:hypothetical protein
MTINSILSWSYHSVYTYRSFTTITHLLATAHPEGDKRNDFKKIYIKVISQIEHVLNGGNFVPGTHEIQFMYEYRDFEYENIGI